MTQLLVDVIAVLRICRLIRDDTITAPIRDRLAGMTVSDRPRIVNAAHTALEIADCPWCLTVWVSAAVIVLGAVGGTTGRLAVRGLAVAEVAGRIRAAEHGGRRVADLGSR